MHSRAGYVLVALCVGKQMRHLIVRLLNINGFNYSFAWNHHCDFEFPQVLLLGGKSCVLVYRFHVQAVVNQASVALCVHHDQAAGYDVGQGVLT
jgi:hypothetical protein